MGYYTYFSLEARHIKDRAEYDSIMDYMKNHELMQHEGEYGIFDEGKFYEEDGIAYFDAYDEAKWYDHTYDMLKLSKAFPKVMFKLSGDGEERDDMWHEYFLNGNSELCTAQVIYPEPTEIDWDDKFIT